MFAVAVSPQRSEYDKMLYTLIYQQWMETLDMDAHKKVEDAIPREKVHVTVQLEPFCGLVHLK